MALYEATDGPNWVNNTNWLSNKPLSEWFGVTSDKNGRVTELRLGENGLTGEIPHALTNLHNLETLYLGGNALIGCIPSSLKDIPGGDASSVGLPSCEPVDAVQSAARDALVALYEATNGPNWINNTNWLSDKHLALWHGVTTDATDSVTEIFPR